MSLPCARLALGIIVNVEYRRTNAEPISYFQQPPALSRRKEPPAIRVITGMGHVHAKPSTRFFVAALALTGSTLTSPAAPDYNRDIRPILSENCFSCHGFDEKARKAELRLDTAEGALTERDGYFPIKAGNPQKSEVWLRIISEDKDEVMPPPKSHLTLKDSEKTLIREWIEADAPYAGHWAFIPPQKSLVPAGEHPIDQFVRATLGKAGLQPAPQAGPHTLIRRLTLDLTGLPPSTAEVQAFLRDSRQRGLDSAYADTVERLLQSPHFGERLALDWLDAARYADTNGFSIDGGRHMWLWRDWVIDAFNRNKPYNEFLTEQIAGDLLPNATEAQFIASGFQRNNMVTHEGGTIPEENLTNYNADRVKTLGEAVLGLTLACAQCHDHKYDPITQADYFSLFAYFNTLGDAGLDGNAGVNPKPFMQARTVLKTGEEPTLQKRIAQVQARLAAPPEAQVAAWVKQQEALLARRGKGHTLSPVEVVKVSTPNKGAGFEVEDERIVRVTQPNNMAAYDILTELPPLDKPVTGLRVVFHPSPDAPGGGWGHGPMSGRPGPKAGAPPQKGNFILTAISVSAGAVPSDQVDLFKLQSVRHVTANVWQPERRPEGCLDMRNDSGWSPPLTHEGPAHLTVTFAEPLDARAAPHLTTQLNFGAGSNLIAARIEILAMTGTDDDSDLEPAVVQALTRPATERDAAAQALIRDAFARLAPQAEPLRIELANLQERLAVLTQPFTTMVMSVAEKPRPTFILNRGDYSQPTVEVSMRTPSFLPRDEGPQDSRLALARWITRPDHPLTARVYVNRLWQMLFGEGIVRTPADFGAQGEWPTHPELLDWLAVDFVESGWDIKALVKKIVLSPTYRQSSATNPKFEARNSKFEDPTNRLLARGPRHRLPAELIRDSALKVSGLLVPRLGGPSVNPYTPGDLWREISHYGSSPATSQTFVQDHGEKLYRRSLYTYWKRTAPPPNMAAFDAPNRETCVVSRPLTNTPLQALVLLNDTQFVEAARGFAQRILARPDVDDTNRLRWAVLEALSRPPTETENRVLLAALERERATYRADEAAARALLRVGESPAPRAHPPAELAAWTQVAATLFNLSEFVTKN